MYGEGIYREDLKKLTNLLYDKLSIEFSGNVYNYSSAMVSKMDNVGSVFTRYSVTLRSFFRHGGSCSTEIPAATDFIGFLAFCNPIGEFSGCLHSLSWFKHDASHFINKLDEPHTKGDKNDS